MSDTTPILVYDSQSEQYRRAFETFLNSTDQKKKAGEWLDVFLDRLPQKKVFIDAGAGTGQLTSRLAPKFSRTIGIEPNPSLCAQFRMNCPDIELISQPISVAYPSVLADCVLCSHVFYYIPHEEWLESLERMVSWLNPGGILLVALQHPETDCMRMLRHFLGQNFDLRSHMEKFKDHYSQTSYLTVETVPAHVQTGDFCSAYVVAEFMLNLVTITNPPTQKAVEEYVSNFFVGPQGGYGFSCHQDFFHIQRKS